MSFVSDRAQNIPPFIVMDVLERAQELEQAGRSIIHMEVGEPDFDTPRPIIDAATAAMQRGETHYTHSLGIPPLRTAIADHYKKEYDVDISPDRIIVTSGTSSALLLILLALLNPGDEVMLPNPRYACYPNFVRAAEGRVIDISVQEEDDFQIPVTAVSAQMTPQTKAVLITSPSNPTGTILSAAQLEELAQAVGNAGPYLISDEIYHGLTYEGRAHSALEFTPRAFVINGFSKRYAMTGWRLGYAIVPEDFIRPVQKLQQNLFICANSFAQRAAIAALTQCSDEVDAMARQYDQRRLRLLEQLDRMGLPVCSKPRGAFYVFVNTKHIDPDSYRLAFDILETAGVAVTPGIDFGSGGEGFLRFSYATSLEAIDEGIRRLEAYLQQRSGG